METQSCVQQTVNSIVDDIVARDDDRSGSSGEFQLLNNYFYTNMYKYFVL